MKLFKKYKFDVVIFITIVVIAGVLRFYNSNWDQGMTFHPDERNIDAAVSRIDFFTQMDPEFFAYGGLSIYMYRAIGETLTYFTGETAWTSNWGQINQIGRFMSAYFSTITIIAIYVLAKRLFSKRVGLLAALFAAFAPSLIQTAHYGITENFLTLMVLHITLATLNLNKKGSFTNFAVIGLLLGIALAAKTAAISFFIVPFTAVLFKLIPIKIKNKKYRLQFIYSAFIPILALITFTALSPYTFLSSEKFLESMEYEGGVVSGKLLVPYVLQFIGTKSYIFQFINLNWQMGIVSVIGVIGSLYILFKSIKEKNKELFLLVVFPVTYFLYVGSWHTKFVRYMLPLIPYLSIFASVLLFSLQKKYKVIGTLLITIFATSSIVWGIAFFSIYLNPQTRIVASEWVYENIPVGSVIKNEHWDDGIPIDLKDGQNRRAYNYEIEQMENYNTDDQKKIEDLARSLSEGDYLILGSRRLYGTLMYLDERYPITSKYYKLLFRESLGYTKVKEFSSYPNIFGFEINDDASEETFQVYDHPKIIVFQNTGRYTYEEIEKILKF